MPMKLILFLIPIFLILSACGQAAAPPPPPTVDPLVADSGPKALDLMTADEIELKATYYPALNPQTKSPAILLIHMLDSSRESWNDFAIALQQAGYAVMTMDLRGHGQSGGFQSYSFMDQDIDAGVKWLTNRPEIAEDRIGIAGAGLGANLALRGGSRYPQVKSVVLLSPGLSYKEVSALEALAAYGQRPVMIVATENDAYAATSSRTLNTQALGQHQLQIYPGTEQGTNIFKAQAGLKPMLLAWFSSTL